MKESPFDKKSCYDCGYVVGKLSLWCTCKEAIKERGTSLPGIEQCRWWTPNWKFIDKEHKTFENGYLSVWKRFIETLKNLKKK